MTDKSPLLVADAIAQMQELTKHSHREVRLVVRKTNIGGLTAHQTTDVVGIYAGFDWEAGQLILAPARPLTELTEEDIAAIRASVAKGSSWHAYKAQEKQAERLLKARTALIKIAQGRDTLTAAEMADLALEGQSLA